MKCTLMMLSDENEIHDEVCEVCAEKVDYCECIRCPNCEQLLSIDELDNCSTVVYVEVVQKTQ